MASIAAAVPMSCLYQVRFETRNSAYVELGLEPFRAGLLVGEGERAGWGLLHSSVVGFGVASMSCNGI